MLRQFEYILEYLTSPDKKNERVGEMEMLNSSDYATIMSWNLGPVQSVNKCIHQLIEQQVCEQPETAVAIHSWDAKLTYEQLDAQSTRLARYLMQYNVESTLIPLLFEKSAFTIVAMLAVLKLGSAFTPLDPAAPISRLEGLLKDTQATLVLCSSKFKKLCSTITSRYIIVDAQMIDNCPEVPGFPTRWDELPSCESKKPAYVIYTSGTTGKPKVKFSPLLLNVSLLMFCRELLFLMLLSVQEQLRMGQP